MKTTVINIWIVLMLFLAWGVHAQEVEQKLDEARSEYKSGNLENARFALQQALQGINQAIGEEILGALPEKMGDMAAVAESDDVTGTNIGFAGLFVSRSYQGEGADASIEIVSDSPMMAAINSLLSMPVFMASDPNQKRIKIDGYKGLLTRSESEEGPVSYDVQIPFGGSLLTFNTTGIDDEKQVTDMAESIPVSDIVKLAQ